MVRVLTALLATMLAANPSSAAPLSATASKDGLSFSASLEKATFLPDEPIICRMTITNLTGKTRRVAEPTRWYGVGLHLTLLKGKGSIPPMYQGTGPGPDPDYGWDLAAGQSSTQETDVTGLFSNSLSVGEYSLTASYDPAEDVKGIWHAKITLLDMHFSVVAPTGTDGEAAKAFGAAKRLARRGGEQAGGEAVALLEPLLDPKRGGVFTRYVGYWLAYANQYVDREKSLEQLRQYVLEHGDVPVYGRGAAYRLVYRLYYDGQQKEALKALANVPDEYERRRWVKKCEAALAKGEEPR